VKERGGEIVKEGLREPVTMRGSWAPNGGRNVQKTRGMDQSSEKLSRQRSEGIEKG